MPLFPIFLLFWTKRLFGGTKLSGVEAGRGLKPIPRSRRCQLHQGSPRKLHTGTGKRRIPDPGQLLTAQQHHFGGIRQQFGDSAWEKKRPSDRNPAPRGARVGLDPHPSSRPAPQGRIWGRFPELPDTRRTAQLHVGTFYSPDALAHCFCSTAKALFIPNRSPSPSSCFFSLYQHPLFPHPSTTLLLSTFGIFSLLGACFLGRSQRTIHSDSLLFFFFSPKIHINYMQNIVHRD